MTTHIAMLRGINVSGHKIVKMKKLRVAFSGLGFVNVRTYVQSGNVVFEAAGSGDEAGLAAKIARRIRSDFGFDVPVLLKTSKEMGGVVRHNPLLKDASIDQEKLHVTFLSSDPPSNALELLAPLAGIRERVRVSRREVYLCCPDGYGQTKLNNTAVESKLGCGATTRNWNTVKALAEMAEQNNAAG